MNDRADETLGEDWGVSITPKNSPQLMQLDPTEETAPEETSIDRVARILGEARDDERSQLKLYRVMSGKLAWCGDYRVSEFEDGGFEMIRREFGPGEYHLRLYGPGPSGRFVVRTKADLTIIPRASDADRPIVQGVQGMDSIVRMMQEQNAQVMRVLTERPQKDPRAEMMETITMIGAMKEAFGGGGNNAGNSISEIMKAIREMKEVSAELNPQSEKEDKEPDLMSMLPSFMEIVKTGMQQRVPQVAEMPAVEFMPSPSIAPNPAVPLHAQQPETAPQIPDDEDPMNLYQMVKLKMLISTVVKMAEKNAPIEPAADLLLAELPEEMLDAMEADDWFPTLQQGLMLLGSDITPHKEWVTKVRESMMAEDPGSAPDKP